MLSGHSVVVVHRKPSKFTSGWVFILLSPVQNVLSFRCSRGNNNTVRQQVTFIKGLLYARCADTGLPHIIVFNTPST